MRRTRYSEYPPLNWKDLPGLWDPYGVARTCIQILMRDLFPRKRPLKNPTAKNKMYEILEPSLGLQMYLEPFVEDPEIEKSIDEYLKYPCQMKLANALKNDSRASLQFMLNYFRRRDPFLLATLTPDTLSKFLSRNNVQLWGASALRFIPELECCAATMIGRYLNYVVFVASAHELFYISDLLAKLWGPLFLGFKVEGPPSFIKQFDQEKQMHLAVKGFRFMLEGVPWNQFRPTEDMTRTMQHDNKFYGYRLQNERADNIIAQTTVPEHQRNNMCDNSLQDLIKNGNRYKTVNDLEDLTWKETNELTLNPYKPDKRFPPDECKISFTDKEPGEQFL